MTSLLISYYSGGPYYDSDETFKNLHHKTILPEL